MRYTRRRFIQDFSTVGIGLPGIGSWLERSISTEDETPLLYFDAFTEIGPRQVTHSLEQTSLSELLEELNFCSISGALVASTLSVSYDAHFSNLKLSKTLAPYPNLSAIWNLFPPETGEFPDLDTLGDLLRQHQVRAVSIHPRSNAWDWRADYCQDFFNWLSDQQVLLIITDYSELGDWSDVDLFLSQYSKLAVFLRHISWSAQRFVIPLVRQHKNLHICFDTFQIWDTLVEGS